MKMSMVMALALSLAGSAVAAEDSGELKDQKSKVSYGIGMNLGTQFRRDEVDIDPELLLRGLKDSLQGKSTLLDEATMRSTLQEYSRETRAKRAEKRRLLGETNKAEGEKFLAENKNQPGVITLPSGLQYKVLTEGSGDSPKSNDVVTVHYRGKLLNGTEFDSSYSRNEPAQFAVKGVIKGWTEALQLMKPGAKWQLFIPGPLAYGEMGSGDRIPPNATLQFDVELISFKPPEPPAAAASTATPQVVTSDIIKVPSKEEMEKGAKIEVLKKEDVDRLVQEQKKKEEAEKK